jgi:hypothetical protein
MPELKQTGTVPRTERPQIPDYGISKSKTGLLPWKWAVKTLTESREYWIVTVRPDGRPHAMIIWGVYSASSKRTSRKPLPAGDSIEVNE